MVHVVTTTKRILPGPNVSDKDLLAIEACLASSLVAFAVHSGYMTHQLESCCHAPCVYKTARRTDTHDSLQTKRTNQTPTNGGPKRHRKIARRQNDFQKQPIRLFCNPLAYPCTLPAESLCGPFHVQFKVACQVRMHAQIIPASYQPKRSIPEVDNNASYIP